MNSAFILVIWLLPLLLASLSQQRYASWLLPLAPLPALLAVIALPVGTTVSLPWLLLGSEFGIDATSRVFLGFSSLLWLVTAVYVAGSHNAVAASNRFRLFFLLAMAGNLCLIVAQDMVSFYFGFALMGLSAYGLVAHSTTRRGRQAARTYLVWTIAGELLLFTAIVSLAASGAGALSFDALQNIQRSPLIVLLLIAGFGIKLALPLVHWWLPPVYAATPVAAIALFSGVMIKAGLLGWLRFLPPGEATPAGWGMLLILIGAVTVLFGVTAGLLQRRPRLLLGYSTISKMGILSTGLGATLVIPAAAPAIVAALLMYVAHHALVKTALFLGLGLVERAGLRLSLLIGLVFLALVLAGAPLSSGALAKSALGDSLSQALPALVTLLVASTLATTLLMVRFVYLLWTRRQHKIMPLPRVPLAAWLCLVALIVVLPLLFAEVDQLLINVIPVSLGVVLGLLAIRFGSGIYRLFIRKPNRFGRQALYLYPITALRNAPGKAHFDKVLKSRETTGIVSANQRRPIDSLSGLQQSWESARRPVTGVVLLCIAGGLLGAFVVAP